MSRSSDEVGINMANAITRLTTWLRGERVGEDELGNIYYQDRKKSQGLRQRRWVIYADGIDEASRVPPAHHAWLHYTIDDFPDITAKKQHGWERDHAANPTGTRDAYLPPGHALSSGRRAKATGDYEAWSPE